MKCYYAVFKKTREAVELEFPDLPGCVPFGKDWDEALANAIDVLAAWLAHAEPQFISEPSSYKTLEKLDGILVPIPVDKEIMSSYQELKRFNGISPSEELHPKRSVAHPWPYCGPSVAHSFRSIATV